MTTFGALAETTTLLVIFYHAIPCANADNDKLLSRGEIMVYFHCSWTECLHFYHSSQDICAQQDKKYSHNFRNVICRTHTYQRQCCQAKVQPRYNCRRSTSCFGPTYPEYDACRFEFGQNWAPTINGGDKKTCPRKDHLVTLKCCPV